MSNGYNLQRIQEIELEILDEIIRICEKNHIKYNLEGGSCLGAVRHDGMIPWDDDIDIAMLREEYNKFYEACKRDLDTSRFLYQDFRTDKSCGLIFTKIRRKDTILSESYCSHLKFHQGVWVDIFCYDSVPSDKKKRDRLRKKMKILQNLYIIRCGYNLPESAPAYLQPIYRVVRFLVKIVPIDFLIGKMWLLMNQYKDSRGKYVFNYGGAYPEKGLFKRELFEHTIDHEFNGRRAKIVEDYPGYLKQLYNDYMKLPPENKRNGGAHFIKEFKDYSKNG